MGNQSHWLGIVELRQTTSVMVCRHIRGWLWLDIKEFDLGEKIVFTEDSVPRYRAILNAVSFVTQTFQR
jgi:hypothetical protein